MCCYKVINMLCSHDYKINLYTCSYILAPSLIHSHTQPLTHSHTHSINHSLTQPLNHSPTYLLLTHLSLTYFLIYLLPYSLTFTNLVHLTLSINNDTKYLKLFMTFTCDLSFKAARFINILLTYHLVLIAFSILHKYS